MYLILHESDAKRFGCDQRLRMDIAEIPIADLCELSDRFGFDVLEWPQPLLGEIAFADAGNPDAKRKPPPWAPWAMVWTALRQNDYDVSWEDAGKSRAMLIRIESEDEEPGKAEQPSDEASTTEPSESSTD